MNKSEPDWSISENHFATADGVSIYYRHWQPNQVNQYVRTIVILHRGHEHSGRVAHIVEELGFKDTSFFAWDARGNGKSEGERGYSPDFATLVNDLELFIRHISEKYQIPISSIIIIAQSLGAVIATTWVHDYAPKIKALILTSPAFKLHLRYPGALIAVKIWQKIKGNFYLKSYIKGKELSHDLNRATSYHNDPLVSLQISSNLLIGIFDTSARIVSDAQAIQVPTLLLISEEDKIVHKKVQEEFYLALGSSIKEKHNFSGFFHDTLGEKERYKAFKAIKNFIEKVEFIYVPINLKNSDQKGVTYDEYVQSILPIPFYSIKNIYYFFLKSYIKLVGKRISKGLKLSHQFGLNSPISLDYIYNNQPEAIGVMKNVGIGKYLDKKYLDRLIWKGLRIRKSNLENLVGKYVKKLNKSEVSVSILDVATGHGGCILNIVDLYKDKIDSILLCDVNESNVRAGEKCIKQNKLQNKAQFLKSDFFSESIFSNIKFLPTLSIISGFCELFPDNNKLNHSLELLTGIIPKGGYLIYTNQSGHTHNEILNRILNKSSLKNKTPQIIRRRIQAEMDQLIENFGFEKVEQLIDPWGIYTVSVAKKFK
ncbi:bifunctional alpha/beta hydrolase/class I SAM-dependent methyltransferase [Apibacter sp. HY039]|uniref:bifunctional alpha/beta hydrolase/class I SAM-dependent methyltransferase n=1 Tax=Apibacter sp. HY039 TaxID=2501476 RepID=UPI000FEB815F|nr:bifunctional alpha/beta hydrolase/class I SAM-dependent methyltransferase [Apibacter sp. HY039]